MPGIGPSEPGLTTLSGSPATAGNRVQVLRNGDATFGAMLHAIRSATSTVDLSSYIFWPGEVATSFTEALADRARAGVEVNVVLDGYGSSKIGPSIVGELRAAGVTVAFFRKPSWYSLHKLNNRMRRRLLIVDGSIAFAGGVGIADVWSGNAEDPDQWRETHLTIEGPALVDLYAGFVENWTEATHVVPGPVHYPKPAAFDDGIEVQ